VTSTEAKCSVSGLAVVKDLGYTRNGRKPYSQEGDTKKERKQVMAQTTLNLSPADDKKVRKKKKNRERRS
jgi:hypothetical protein